MTWGRGRARTRHGTESAPPARLALAALALAAIAVGVVIVVRRRRRRPVPEPPRVLTLPRDAAELDNIFDIEFVDRATLRVGYSLFPTGTEVHWTVVDDRFTMATGAFVARGGGSQAHIITQLLEPALVGERAEVHFMWMIAEVPFHYTVRRELTLL